MKFNLKGLDKRLIGAIGGGLSSAMIDQYVTPALPTSLAAYPDYVKMGIGIVLPMFFKDQTVLSISDGIMACAAQNITNGLLGTSTETGVTGTQASRVMVGAPRLKSIKPNRLAGANPQRAADVMVGKSPKLAKVVC